MRRQGESGRDDSVKALPTVEAQMVSDHQEVQAGLGGSLDEEARRLRCQSENRVMDREADLDHRLTRSRAITRFWISAVPSATR